MEVMLAYIKNLKNTGVSEFRTPYHLPLTPEEIHVFLEKLLTRGEIERLEILDYRGFKENFYYRIK